MSIKKEWTIDKYHQVYFVPNIPDLKLHTNLLNIMIELFEINFYGFTNILISNLNISDKDLTGDPIKDYPTIAFNFSLLFFNNQYNKNNKKMIIKKIKKIYSYAKIQQESLNYTTVPILPLIKKYEGNETTPGYKSLKSFKDVAEGDGVSIVLFELMYRKYNGFKGAFDKKLMSK